MFAKTLKLELLRLITVPPCQVQKASYPLFEYCPGSAGFPLVAVSKCPCFLAGELWLSWPAMTPWPWPDQKPPLVHPFIIPCWSVALHFLSVCMSSPSVVWLVLVMLVLGLQTELLEPRWDFNSCRRALIEVYYVVVVATSCSRTALSLVAADAMLSDK